MDWWTVLTNILIGQKTFQSIAALILLTFLYHSAPQVFLTLLHTELPNPNRCCYKANCVTLSCVISGVRPSGDIIGSHSLTWTSEKLNWSPLFSKVSNLESEKEQNKEEVCSDAGDARGTTAAAGPQGVSLKMNGKCCVFTPALDLMVSFLLTIDQCGPIPIWVNGGKWMIK